MKIYSKSLSLSVPYRILIWLNYKLRILSLVKFSRFSILAIMLLLRIKVLKLMNSSKSNIWYSLKLLVEDKSSSFTFSLLLYFYELFFCGELLNLFDIVSSCFFLCGSIKYVSPGTMPCEFLKRSLLIWSSLLSIV